MNSNDTDELDEITTECYLPNGNSYTIPLDEEAKAEINALIARRVTLGKIEELVQLPTAEDGIGLTVGAEIIADRIAELKTSLKEQS